ncbi:MAG: hypothetical protein NC320_02015 [Clostridium sp.]|nr:hypothetical protein [Clostridium sp.]
MKANTCNKRDIDFMWFINNYDRIFKEYGHKLIVVKNESIIGVFNNPKEALNALSTQYEPGSYILQECDGTETAYTATIRGMMIYENI